VIRGATRRLPEIASEIALDKAQMAPEYTYPDARSEGVSHY